MSYMCVLMLVMIYHTVGCVPPKLYHVPNIANLNFAHPDYFPSLKVDDHKICSNKSKVYKMCVKEGIICIPNNYSKLELPDQLKATKVTISNKLC